MTALLILPLLLQGLFICVDEFIFHHRRGLPTWEIWGHPLDTLFVLLPFGLIVFSQYGDNTLYYYIGFSVFSCLFITKDEFVHARLCEPMEQWLHAVLFVLHPLSFIAAALLWRQGEGTSILLLQFVLVLTFLVYQIFYWGKPWQWLQKKINP